MDNNLKQVTDRDKMLYVVTETTKEMNRVMNTWSESNMLRSFDEYKSLFRTFFFKFAQIKFGWGKCSTIKYAHILPVIKENKLLDISISYSSFSERTTLGVLKDVVDNFDFQQCFQQFPPKDYSNIFRRDTRINRELTIESINFDDILNIKF